jgi:hypothetical protein
MMRNLSLLVFCLSIAALVVTPACSGNGFNGGGDAGGGAPDGNEGDGGTDVADGGTPDTVYKTATYDSATSYTNSEGASREVKVRIWYPVGFTGAAPVILVSHGGDGNTTAHTHFVYLGSEFAAHGYLSVHLNHNESTSAMQHRLDRPADVSAVLDALESGTMPLPPAFGGTADLARIGHTGHSWGAYTSHAVGGATFTQGTFRDARVKTIAPLSPQGWDQFGSFDEQHDPGLPSSSNSWQDVRIPAFNIVGGAEKDSHAGPGGYQSPDWRLFPFLRYPEEGDKYLAIIPGQEHNDIGGAAEPAVLEYMAVNLRLFFDVHLKGQVAKVCLAGREAWVKGVDLRFKHLPSSPAAACPPMAGGGTP